MIQCAEAIVEIKGGLVYKRRVEKKYRLREIDEKIRKERTKSEAKIISEARKNGVPTPIIFDVTDHEIVMEKIEGNLAKEELNEEISEKIGQTVAILHKSGIIHGDLTTSNIIMGEEGILYLIDFGLSVFEPSIEARGVDIHVFFQCLKGTHEAEGYDKLRDSFIKGYKRRFKGVGADADKVLNRVKQIESRGRYIERKERVIAKCLIQSDV